jgi:hypothetical protein
MSGGDSAAREVTGTRGSVSPAPPTSLLRLLALSMRRYNDPTLIFTLHRALRNEGGGPSVKSHRFPKLLGPPPVDPELVARVRSY